MIDPYLFELPALIGVGRSLDEFFGWYDLIVTVARTRLSNTGWPVTSKPDRTVSPIRLWEGWLPSLSRSDAPLGRGASRADTAYEDVVEDLAAGVRRILEFCGLEFEPGCVEFYKTDRSVRTASSEQVRQPIFREGLFQWGELRALAWPAQRPFGRCTNALARIGMGRRVPRQ